MTTRITRIGNTLSVEIPEDLVAQSALPVGEPVEWVPGADGGLSLVKPAAKARKRKTLDELLEGVPEETRLEECAWGPGRGQEAW